VKIGFSYFLGGNLMMMMMKMIYISSNIVQLITFKILGDPIDWQFNINDMELATWQCGVGNLVNLMVDDLKTNWTWQSNEMDVNLIILQNHY
jgi:hypothetical protein